GDADRGATHRGADALLLAVGGQGAVESGCSLGCRGCGQRLVVVAPPAEAAALQPIQRQVSAAGQSAPNAAPPPPHRGRLAGDALAERRTRLQSAEGTADAGQRTASRQPAPVEPDRRQQERPARFKPTQPIEQSRPPQSIPEQSMPEQSSPLIST